MKLSLAAGAAAVLVGAGPATSQSDVAGSADHPMVGRYEGSVITLYQQKDYEEVGLPREAIPAKDRNAPGPHLLPLAGKLTAIRYEGPPERSALEVVRNYRSSLEGRGFKTLFACRQDECGGAAAFWDAARGPMSIPSQWDTNTYALLELDRREGKVWVSVLAVETKATASRPTTAHVALRVVEAKAIELDRISVVAASKLKETIDATGRVAVYGIFFDVDKAALKADSKPQVDEIAKLMKDNPVLSVLVVGHTDATGSLDHNRDLSERRAAAVVNALVTGHGIARGRLFAVGVGPAAPVATNRTEEGRARNRRVEIVELPGAS